MKKVISSLLVLSVVLLSTVAKAGNVTLEQAKAIGAYYMSYQLGSDKIASEHLTLAYQFENPDMDATSAYVFNVKGNGWIIIAGSSVVNPVIAYSEEGSLDMNKIPDNLRWWLTRYTDVIADIQRLDAEKGYPDSEEYTKLTNNGLKNGSKANSKVQLMTTSWGQGSSYNSSHTYNYYCPEWNGRYCVTGCVATALSQICKYYEFPKKPQNGRVTTTFHSTSLEIRLDTVSFDYSLMPNKLKESTTMDKVQEVAKLNYTIGVAVKMSYDPDGSAAYTTTAMEQMRFKFKYSKGTLYRRSTNDTTFINTLRRHLMNNDVVYMDGVSSIGSGADAGGHAWVCSGYQTEDVEKYYMNWGWEGTGNGWFNLVENNMYISQQGYNFNQEQACIFNMLPPEDSNIHHNNVGIREVEFDNTLLGTAYPNPATLSVTLPYSTETAADMQVYGIDGRLVSTTHVQPGTGEVTLRVDALPKGVYIYRLNSQSGKFIVR